MSVSVHADRRARGPESGWPRFALLSPSSVPELPKGRPAIITVELGARRAASAATDPFSSLRAVRSAYGVGALKAVDWWVSDTGDCQALPGRARRVGEMLRRLR
jgi:hypothetical protein